MNGRDRLYAGAYLHFVVAAAHLACLFFLDAAFEAYGIQGTMKRLTGGHTWLLYAFTAWLAVAFTIAGLFALSAAGRIRHLPFTRLACATVVAVYSLRAIMGFASCAVGFSWLQFSSSALPAIIAYCYWPGAKRQNYESEK